MLKNYLIIAAFTLGSLPAIAQRLKPAATSLVKADTAYFDRDWERTEILEEVRYARIARHDKDGKCLGTVNDYFYPSWKKQWEGKLTREAPDIPSGLCTGWHENGRLSFRGTYMNGQQQGDFKSWREDGREIKCTYATQDALPLMSATLYCLNCMSSSRKVFTVDLPANTVGIVYKIDIRDGEQPISWSTALSIAGAVGTGGATAPALLAAATTALRSRGNTPTTKPTQCHWYITPNSASAQEFLNTKGTITNLSTCYRSETNVPQVTSPLTLSAGTRRLFICVNNNNQVTDATATLSVTALVENCK